MLDQNTQIMTTASSVKSVSKRPPLILPEDPVQICTLMTYWKICPMAKRRAAPTRYTALVSSCRAIGRPIRTHWFPLSKNAEYKEGFQAEEDEQENQRHELVKRVKRVGFVLAIQGVVPVAGPAKASVESDVTCADEQDDSGDEKQPNRDGSAVIQKLVAD
jgi:hypothetical protein